MSIAKAIDITHFLLKSYKTTRTKQSICYNYALRVLIVAGAFVFIKHYEKMSLFVFL